MDQNCQNMNPDPIFLVLQFQVSARPQAAQFHHYDLAPRKSAPVYSV